jgi:hypothetical protein
VRLAYRVELVEDSPVEPDEPVAFRMALVLDADASRKLRGDAAGEIAMRTMAGT